MKKIFVLVVVLLIIALLITFVGADKTDNSNYLRIHIRANSNSEIDQDVKYVIKGEIVKYLSPQLEGVKSSEKAKQIVTSNMQNIENIANKVLNENNLNYKCTCKINREHFPIRHYGNLTLQDGIYDALIVELGKAEGNNWWCVVFPPLCFVESEEVGSGEFQYVSKIKEIIDKLRGK